MFTFEMDFVPTKLILIMMRKSIYSLALLALTFLVICTLHVTFHVTHDEAHHHRVRSLNAVNDVTHEGYSGHLALESRSSSIESPMIGGKQLLDKDGNPETKNHNTIFKDETYSKHGSTKDRQSIVFVKVHKAASSTVHGVLMRFALKNKLQVMLKRSGGHLGEHTPEINALDLLPLPKGRVQYDVLCNHVIFDKEVISPYFPTDVFYLGIVRAPFRQFISAFTYYSVVHQADYLANAFAAEPDNPIGEFLNHPLHYLNGTPPNFNHINNRMSVDYGFPLNGFEEAKTNALKIKSFVETLNKTFDFIMVTEMFDESIVLLRRYLGWTTQDVVYLDKQVMDPRALASPWTRQRDYPTRVKMKFDKWAAIDTALYDFFLNELKNRIKLQPPDFHDEVKEMKVLKANISKCCAQTMQQGNDSALTYFPNTDFTSEVKVTYTDCHYMQLSAFDLTEKYIELRFNTFYKSTRNKP